MKIKDSKEHAVNNIFREKAIEKPRKIGLLRPLKAHLPIYCVSCLHKMKKRRLYCVIKNRAVV